MIIHDATWFYHDSTWLNQVLLNRVKLLNHVKSWLNPEWPCFQAPSSTVPQMVEQRAVFALFDCPAVISDTADVAKVVFGHHFARHKHSKIDVFSCFFLPARSSFKYFCSLRGGDFG